ncbi:hypothetical protein E2C01_093339 [Portunus trituberculatus]|uniref:Uncharacterized protein n=1 Tax=Portunus trituberculatus TaxID=210409 RepID=A0A5B7JMG8_PORTR|nr:hypothetical protein [Portunus trituberculatus]
MRVDRPSPPTTSLRSLPNTPLPPLYSIRNFRFECKGTVEAGEAVPDALQTTSAGSSSGH